MSLVAAVMIVAVMSFSSVVTAATKLKFAHV
jgi:hypothetical protein